MGDDDRLNLRSPLSSSTKATLRRPAGRAPLATVQHRSDDALDRRIELRRDSLEKKIDALDARINQRFNEINAKIDRHFLWTGIWIMVITGWTTVGAAMDRVELPTPLIWPQRRGASGGELLAVHRGRHVPPVRIVVMECWHYRHDLINDDGHDDRLIYLHHWQRAPCAAPPRRAGARVWPGRAVRRTYSISNGRHGSAVSVMS